MSPQRQARPPERAAAPAAPAPSPELLRGYWRRSHPYLQLRPGLRPAHPSRLQDLVPRLLRVARRLLNTQLLGSEPSWAGPAACLDGHRVLHHPLRVLPQTGREIQHSWAAGLRVLSASTMWLEEPIGKGWFHQILKSP